jgi:hypothetical protein
VLTYLFFLAIQFSLKKFSFVFALLIPILAAAAAFCIGAIVLMTTPLAGVPRQYILLYGLLYGLIILLAVFKSPGRTQKNLKS